MKRKYVSPIIYTESAEITAFCSSECGYKPTADEIYFKVIAQGGDGHSDQACVSALPPDSSCYCYFNVGPEFFNWFAS